MKLSYLHICSFVSVVFISLKCIMPQTPIQLLPKKLASHIAHKSAQSLFINPLQELSYLAPRGLFHMKVGFIYTASIVGLIAGEKLLNTHVTSKQNTLPIYTRIPCEYGIPYVGAILGACSAYCIIQGVSFLASHK